MATKEALAELYQIIQGYQQWENVHPRRKVSLIRDGYWNEEKGIATESGLIESGTEVNHVPVRVFTSDFIYNAPYRDEETGKTQTYPLHIKAGTEMIVQFGREVYDTPRKRKRILLDGVINLDGRLFGIRVWETGTMLAETQIMPVFEEGSPNKRN